MDIKDVKRIHSIALAYYKFKQKEYEEEHGVNRKKIPFHFVITHVEELAKIHQSVCALDLKHMVGDLKKVGEKYDVYQDLETIFYQLNKTNSVWTLDKDMPEGQTFIPKYIKKPKDVNPIGRPISQDVNVFRTKYQPETKVYKEEELIDIDEKQIWTIERRPKANPKKDKLYILPGLRHTDCYRHWNVIGYLKATVPWTDSKEQFKWDLKMEKIKEEKMYEFSYVTKFGRTYIAIKAKSMEEAHEYGKKQALKRYPDAHGFLTERIGEVK